MICIALLSILRSLRRNQKLVSFEGGSFGLRSGYSKYGIFALQGNWFDIPKASIRYFDVPAGYETNPQGTPYISFVDSSDRTQNYILPLSGLEQADIDRFFENLRGFWPEYTETWQDQLAHRRGKNCIF